MNDFKFDGFDLPKENWSKLPHQFIESLHQIKSLAELKVILYVLRHTWGYAEYGPPKRITGDEFQFGRKRRDGTRIDNGTGLSDQGARTGLELAVVHGFLIVEVDASDAARMRKFYAVNLAARAPDLEQPDDRAGAKDLPPEPKVLPPSSKTLAPDQRKKLEEDTSREEKNMRQKTPRPPAELKEAAPFEYQWPEKVAALGAAFVELIGRDPMNGSEYAFWLHGSRDKKGLKHYLQAGITADELRLAHKEMVAQKLDFKIPDSFWSKAWKIHQRNAGLAATNPDAVEKLRAERRAEIARMRAQKPKEA